MQTAVIVKIPPPFQRKHVHPSYYLLLGWVIIAVLNKLAIFFATGLGGKFFVFSWFLLSLTIFKYGVFPAICDLILLIYTVAFASIPTFASFLVIGDLIVNCLTSLGSGQNYLQQLFSDTKLKVELNSQKVTRYKRIFRFNREQSKIYRPLFKFNSLTKLDKKWLQQEIEIYQQNFQK